MSEDIKQDRRRFLRNAAASFVAADLATMGFAKAHTSFASVKHIDAGALNVGYAETGPAKGPVVILLHGWPYDIYSYANVAPHLASAGYRVIVPYLRGFGSTRFLSAETFRSGEQAIFAVDTIALMDALRVDKAIVGGLVSFRSAAI